jgi:hypothetical protein
MAGAAKQWQDSGASRALRRSEAAMFASLAAQSGDREVARAGHGPGGPGAVSPPVRVSWPLLRPFMKSP